MKRKILMAAGAAFLVVVILLFALCFRIVPTGHTAVLTTFGKVEEHTLPPGAHFKGIFQKIILMDNREQKIEFENLAFSSDIQEVRVKGSMNFNIDKETAMRLYREVGVHYADVLITPRLAENMKGVFAKFKAEGLIENRTTLSDLIKDAMKEDLNEYGINIISVAVNDVDFSDAFTDAVEAKQVAEQSKLKNAIEQQQLTNEARQRAEREVIQADAELEKTKKAADAEAYAITQKAEAEAAANIKLAESITPELTEYLEVLRWDGKRVVTINGGSLPVLNLGGQE